MTSIAIIGVGRMGSHIGLEFLLAGNAVTFVARAPNKARERIGDAIALVRRHRLASDSVLGDVSRSVSVVSSLDALDGVTLIIESVTEDFDIKAKLLAGAAARFPKAVLTSNTSSLSIDRLGEAAGAAERTLGMHYLNPALLMPLVEVIAGTHTDNRSINLAVALLREAGKVPVLVRRDVPGFVWNRLQCALIREALWLVDNGVASPETIDEVVRGGLARRWRYVGPFETIGLGGAQVFEAATRNLFPHLSVADRPGNLRERIESSSELLAQAAARRDASLARDLRLERGLD